MRKALVLLALVACKQSPPAPDAAAEPPKASASAAIATPSDPIRDGVRKWSDAHARRDAQALADVYADEVSHYGTEMTRATIVKAKADAFAASPDFTQTVGDVSVEPGLNGDERWARFSKTVTKDRKTNDHPALLVFKGGRIVREDDDKDWCLAGDGSGTNDRIVPPFTMSAYAAVQAVNASKYFRSRTKWHSALVVDTKGFSCAKVCAKASYECGFKMRLSDLSMTSESNLVEWIYVDPATKTLWYVESHARGVWASQPLPPVAD